MKSDESQWKSRLGVTEAQTAAEIVAMSAIPGPLSFQAILKLEDAALRSVGGAGHRGTTRHGSNAGAGCFARIGTRSRTHEILGRHGCRKG